MKNFFFVLFVSYVLVPSALVSQNIEERRKQEFEAVKNYQSNYLKQMAVKNKPVVDAATIPDKYGSRQLGKTNAYSDRKSFFMNGNKIKTELENYGGIAPGYNSLREVTNLVWHNLPYIFQFCPIVGASVPDPANPVKRLHIISDGLNDYPNYREVSPKGDTLWQWEPLPGFADPTQSEMASNPALDSDHDGKPDSWPREWYNAMLGKYVWPGYLTQGVNNADLEVFWRMDDRDNSEFPYMPFADNTTRRGLGIQIDGRAFQWSNSLAENAIFFVYTITNVSDKDIDTMFFGVYGDPDIGGQDNKDDNGFFIPPYAKDGSVDKIPVYARSMVYFWDPDGIGDKGLPLGYLGCKFLESPGNPNDGIDNDGDGIADERQNDGIDNDHDWIAATDDVGIDGIPNTGDNGEEDGIPTAGVILPNGSLDPLHPGEPNFEYTDLDEADQIGLTSFNSWTWAEDKISNDESMWYRNVPRNFGDIQQSADIVFVYGSGYISLKKGETKRISMALLFGKDLNDLLTSAQTVQDIYNKNYRFFKPPNVPKVTAVGGDKKVTLYWDKNAEESLDPITGKDFEGYVIYRSTDANFNDIQTVTDGKAANFLSLPLKDINGFDCKWDVNKIDEPFTDENGNGIYDSGEKFVDINKDAKWTSGIEDPWKGYHPVAYQGRGIHYYLGDNTGLVHSYIDSNNVINGQTYYYAVVAYDHGDSLGIPPSETTKKITVDPITSTLRFDDNTVQVIPGPRTSGYEKPIIGSQNISHDSGIGSGVIIFDILDDLAVKDNEYKLTFSDSLTYKDKRIAGKNYSVLCKNSISENFYLYDVKYTDLNHANIVNESLLKVTDEAGTIFQQGSDFNINFQRGAIQRTANSKMPAQGKFIINYRYFPVFESRYLDGNDANSVFDGVNLKVLDASEIDINNEKTTWVKPKTNCTFIVKKVNLTKAVKVGADYEISFSSTTIDSAFKTEGTKLIKIPVNYSVKNVTTGVPERINTFLQESASSNNKHWDLGEDIYLFKPGSKGSMTDTLTWAVTIKAPSDSNIVPIPPADNDLLAIFTNRPFTAQDSYTLKTEAARINKEKTTSALNNIYVVPNPYVGYSTIEPTNKLPGQTRGERRIYFENLPSQCTIKIFTLSGDPVQTLIHETGMQNGREYWNLLNKDGFSVSYGLYIAHIEAPGIGEKTIKFALIK